MDDPQFEIEMQILAQAIDEMDYYQVLKVDQNATAGQIKASYYRESRVLHPDRFFQSDSEEIKANVMKVYKRVTEAYMVLKDYEKRAKYTADINGPDRASRLRYTEESEQEQKQAKDEQTGKTPQAKQCYRQAILDMQQKRWEKAERNLKTALMYESDNELFKEKLEECQKHIDEGPAPTFKIG
ncbi:MAG: J domain-containing protein [Myxococcota bacterium]